MPKNKSTYNPNSIEQKWSPSAKASRGKQEKYDPNGIESKWQKIWWRSRAFVADINSPKPHFYNLWMFPYPSGEGLHAGHAFASTGSDIYGRFMRMHGAEVFQPIGYDSFGIHSENFAIKIGQTPQEMLTRTTKHYEEQLRSLGHGYDWTRTVTTSDIDYYRWTQWLFVQMFEAGLAYKKKATVNYCPSCKTVLADEQVVSPKQAGKTHHSVYGDEEMDESIRVCERCGTPVVKKDLEQWFFRITDYADRLLTGLDKIDWSERVVTAQKEWIGKKEGVVIEHKVEGLSLVLKAFSAYPAWLFADTFLVIAPEHPLVNDLVQGTKYQKEVLDFVERIKNKTKIERGKEKLGIFTGRYAVDPFSGNKMPIWLANFALMDFGTGIIRCSANDIRDYEFATKYKIPLKEVVDRVDSNVPVNAHTNNGVLKDSGPFTGESISESVIKKMLDWIEEKKIGKRETTYHLRDWLVSRQRYWGPPIPMIYCETCAKEGRGWLSKNKSKIHTDHSDWNSAGWWPEANLPVELPEIKEYQPLGTGKSPLGSHPEFYEVKCPECGSDSTRETDVLDTFVDSSWYFLRYASVGLQSADKLPFDAVVTRDWLPVSLYFGGAEHSVLHLMYARFVTMMLYDLKQISFEEPFPKFFAHGLMIKDGAKMSKSRGNVVNPDEYISKFGADTLRLYTMFMGPMDGYPDFRDTGIEGMQKFVKRIWRLFTKDPTSPGLRGDDQRNVLVKMHQTIKKVTEDIQEFRYNTAISSLMEYVNILEAEVAESRKLTAESLKVLALLIAPFAPHLAEEIWHEVLGNKDSIHKANWPTFDPKFLETSEVEIVIQVNGKLRGQLVANKDQAGSEEKVVGIAKSDPKISKWIEGKTIKKVIFVPGKLVNFVID